MREVLRTPYFVVTVDEEPALIRITRTGEAFASAKEAQSRWLEVSAALDQAGRQDRCLLTDLRLGPARNDPAFEAAVRSVVPKLHQGFRRNAVLVRLAVGVLQIRRHAREDGVERLVTDSEDAALVYLREGSPSSTSRR